MNQPTTKVFGSGGDRPGNNRSRLQPSFKVIMSLGLILLSVLDFRHGRRSLWPNRLWKKSVVNIRQVERQGQIVGGYVLGAVLGEGSFGKVYKATKDGREYAVKESKNMYQADLASFKQELEAMTQLKGVPGIVQLVDVMEADGKYYVVMPLAKGDVGKLVKEHKLSNQKVRQIFKQLVQTVEAMHKKGWCHLDIKPDNLLCLDDECQSVALTDFGTASKNKTFRNIVGTPLYTSPEAFEAKTKAYNGKLLDIWSMGVVLYEMLTYEPPFTGKHEWDMVRAIQTKDVVCPSDTSNHAACDLIKKMLVKDPKRRISIAKIKKSDYWKKGENARKRSSRRSY